MNSLHPGFSCGKRIIHILSCNILLNILYLMLFTFNMQGCAGKNTESSPKTLFFSFVSGEPRKQMRCFALRFHAKKAMHKCIAILFRRRRDLNPRAAINDLPPFQGCPFSLLGTSPKPESNQIIFLKQKSLSAFFKRRGWDSNPCVLADKRFSRPPRYSHFDTSPTTH